MNTMSRGGSLSPLRRERRTNYPDLSFKPIARSNQPKRPKRGPRPIEQLGWTLLNPDGSPVRYSPEASGGGD
jgi:hypothetical protein